MDNSKSSVNNVFLFGAGFTKAVFPNAPLNKDLLPVLCKGTSCTTLKKYYKEHKTNDIEILLTHLDLEILRPKHKQQIALQEVRKAIERQLAEYFEQFRFKEEVLEGNRWLESFVKLFIENDAIITLNYDCFLEGLLDYYEVWSPRRGYAVLENILLDQNSPPNSKNILIYKIHGSEHFIEAPGFPNKQKTTISFPVNELIYPRSGKNSDLRYGMDDPKSHIYIIAPSFVKIPHQDIELMMLKALKTVVSARNFVIIGCGLRKEDTFLWLLLTNFLNQDVANRKLIIIDPYAEDIKSKILAHYFVDIDGVVNISLFPKGLEHVIEQLTDELKETVPKS